MSRPGCRRGVRVGHNRSDRRDQAPIAEHVISGHSDVIGRSVPCQVGFEGSCRRYGQACGHRGRDDVGGRTQSGCTEGRVVEQDVIRSS